MLYNVQVSDLKSISNISLAAIGHVAIASSENGGSGVNCNCTWLGKCKSSGNGAKCASFGGNGNCQDYNGNC